MVYQDSIDSLNNGGKTDAIIIDFSKAFDSVLHDWMLTDIVASGVDSRVVVWIREFLLSHTQRIRVGGELCVRSVTGIALFISSFPALYSLALLCSLLFV
jgi:hypothetical protein